MFLRLGRASHASEKLVFIYVCVCNTHMDVWSSIVEKKIPTYMQHSVMIDEIVRAHASTISTRTNFEFSFGSVDSTANDYERL